MVVVGTIAAVSLTHVPPAALAPAFAGLACWTVGDYLLCPLRWSGLSSAARSPWWHVRVYAEAELLGLATPSHSGADLWRVTQVARTGVDRSQAVVEVASDRLVGGLAILAVAACGGVALPRPVLVAAVGLAAGVLALGLLARRQVRRHRPLWLERAPSLPPRRRIAPAVGLSLVYQAGAALLLLGTVQAVGSDVDPVALLGVAGAAQVAALLPGMHGAGAREGALVAGLMSLGVPLHAAVGATALGSTLAWLPALLLGGGGLLVRQVTGRRPHPGVAG